jgi:peptidylprolyl isomerase domain and WD repeat-containing protein 1
LFSFSAGIKLVNIYTNKGVRVMGKSENMRYLNVSVFQGLVKNSQVATTVEVTASENPQLDEGVCDPTLFATAYKKNR